MLLQVVVDDLDKGIQRCITMGLKRFKGVK